MEVYWYAIRVSYGRVLKFSAQLQELGVEHFVPMCTKKIEKNGKITTVKVPAVSNLCFVRTTKSYLDNLFLEMGENRHVHYIWDKATCRPITVPDKAMADFIQICLITSDETLYLKDITSKLREGQKVRVIDGPFKGIEGVVLRIRRSRRVVVQLPDMLAVATTFVNPKDLELI